MVATVPVRMTPFSSWSLRPVTSLDRAFQRHLDLGQRRDRDPDRQIGVEHVVVAHVGMGQHVVAERLGVPQARAMAEHDPGMRAAAPRHGR